jgi:deoxycytidine triphosphate deaminase
MQDKKELPDQNYQGSVLLADRIKKFVDKDWLIRKDTFDEGQLKRAKYDVRLGKAYYKAGKYGNLSDDNPLLEIEPYELVFVESYEIFEMPKNVVAMYDLRVSGCLGGMGLQTGLQIDPTYCGRIFCPLFNFSDTRVTLKYKHHLASV